MDIVATLAALFVEQGDLRYDDSRAESVSAREHALQCAQLAEWAHAAPTLVAAALIHDVGHFLAVRPRADDTDERDDAHELRAMPLLVAHFDRAVTEPVRLHVAAKRYLVTVDADYAAALSPASTHSLRLQGGPMNRAEARAFEALPFAMDAVALRRWDDLAKEPGRPTASLEFYLPLLREQADRRRVADQDTRLPRT